MNEETEGMSFVEIYLDEVAWISKNLQNKQIEKAADILVATRKNSGRLFIIGAGGSAATASHAVNDFRKICGIESYSPVDNVAELTAITNDYGWQYSFVNWLIGSKIDSSDVLLVFSVGGGDSKKGISENIVLAINYALSRNSKIISVVGRNGGHAGECSNATIIIPTIESSRVTPHTEEFGSVILHLLVSHPKLKEKETTWEKEDGQSIIS